MKTNLTHFTLLAAALLLAACEKPLEPDNHDIPEPELPASPRVLVLNEGAWGGNNASITNIDNVAGKIDNTWFVDANSRGLGDVAQDLIVYGSKAYATVTFSNSLEVIDTATGQSTRIDLGNRTPRYIAADGGRLYITCYRPHSVVCIDTAALTSIVATCQLGDYNPEGIAAVGGKLWVASSYVQTENSSYLRDTLLYVIDAQTMTVDTTLTVGLNPQLVVDIDGRHIAVTYNGDYSAGSAGCAIVDANTMTVSQTGLALTHACASEGKLVGFVRQGYSSSSTATYHTVDPVTMAATSFSCDINTPYGIGVDPANGDIYVFTDGNYTAKGDIVCLRADGTQRWRREAGWLPKKAVFLQ